MLYFFIIMFLFFPVNLMAGVSVDGINTSGLYVNTNLDFQESTVLTDDVFNITATGVVRGSPGKIVKIKCISGTNISITIRDNPHSALGEILFSQTMSTNQYVDTDIDCVNGAWAVFSGTATFEITTREYR